MNNIEIIKSISKKLITLQVEFGLLGSCVMLHLLLHDYLKERYNLDTKLVNGFCHTEDEDNENVTTHFWLKYKNDVINITLNHTNTNKLYLLDEELYSPNLRKFVLIENEETMKSYMPKYQTTNLHFQINKIIESDASIKEYLVNSPNQLCEKIIAHLENTNVSILNKQELSDKIRQLYESLPENLFK